MTVSHEQKYLDFVYANQWKVYGNCCGMKPSKCNSCNILLLDKSNATCLFCKLNSRTQLNPTVS